MPHHLISRERMVWWRHRQSCACVCFPNRKRHDSFHSLSHHSWVESVVEPVGCCILYGCSVAVSLVICTDWLMIKCRRHVTTDHFKIYVKIHRAASALNYEQDSVPSATVPSQWSAVASGTLFPFPSPLLHLSLSSGHASNHTCLNGHSRQTVTDTYL